MTQHQHKGTYDLILNPKFLTAIEKVNLKESEAKLQRVKLSIQLDKLK